MKRFLKTTVAAMLSVVMVFGLFAGEAFAADKQTVKQCIFTSKVNRIEKMATEVKEGTTKLTVTRGTGFLKFTAPAAKEYSFTYSDVKGKHRFDSYVSFFKKTKKNSIKDLTVVTKGGKTDTLRLSVNGKKHKGGKLVDRPLKKRTGTVKLKKGQIVYMYFYNAPAHNTLKLAIK